MNKELPNYAQLIEYYITTCGSYLIDRNPHEVDIDWIRVNAYQPELPALDKVSKEAMEDARSYCNEGILREKLVFSLLSNWGSISDIPNVAECLHEYIVNGKSK